MILNERLNFVSYRFEADRYSVTVRVAYFVNHYFVRDGLYNIVGFCISENKPPIPCIQDQ